MEVFAEAEIHLDLKLPTGLKKILISNGYDNQKVISSINEKDLFETEEFARTILPEILDVSDYDEYYGIFSKNVSKYKILDGHKKQLLFIVEYYKKQQERKRKAICTSSLHHIKPKKINISETIPNSSNMQIHRQILNSNLPDEEKVIKKTISEWFHQKYGTKKDVDQEIVTKIFDNQMVVSLQNDSDISSDGHIREINSANKLICRITCFCGINIKIFKIAKLIKFYKTNMAFKIF